VNILGVIKQHSSNTCVQNMENLNAMKPFLGPLIDLNQKNCNNSVFLA